MENEEERNGGLYEKCKRNFEVLGPLFAADSVIK
jgi:hypothetical protein